MTPSSHAHPGPEELDALLDPGGDARVGRHVRDCEQCRAVVHDLREVRAMLRDQVVEADPPPEVAARILAALAAEPPLGAAGPAFSGDGSAFFDDTVPVFDIWNDRPMSGHEPLTDADAIDLNAPAGRQPVADRSGREVGARDADVVELRPRRRWGLRLLAAAAGVALIGGAGTTLWRTTQEPVTMSAAAPDQAEENATDAAAGSPTLDSPSPLGAAGVAETAGGYTATNLDEKVHALLQQTGDRRYEPSTDHEIGSPLARMDIMQSCLTTLGAPGVPLAVDVGTWEGLPALIIVADNPDPTLYTVYTVDQQCQAGVNGAGFQSVHSVRR